MILVPWCMFVILPHLWPARCDAFGLAPGSGEGSGGGAAVGGSGNSFISRLQQHHQEPPVPPLLEQHISGQNPSATEELQETHDLSPQYSSLQDDDEDAPAPVAGIIVVDPFCDWLGKRFSQRIKQHGFASVEVLSDHLIAALDLGGTYAENFRAPEPGLPTAVWAAEMPFPILGAISESDAGLATAERLQAALCGGLGGVNEARRDKRLMSGAVESAGLAVPLEAMVRREEAALSFFKSLGTEARAVVKPPRGCASTDVFFCNTEEDVSKAFRHVHKTNRYSHPGEINEEVLIQAFLEGTEYAVDTVSLKGEHKVMAIWKYDKRAVNGAPFVYFSTSCISCCTDEAKAVIDYTRRVLDALKIEIGAAHTEIMLTPDRGPVLIEMNGRWQLTNFAPMMDRCIGYNAVDALADAYVDPQSFQALPAEPTQQRAVAKVVHLVSYVSGILVAIHHLEEISSLRSVTDVHLFPKFSHLGEQVEPTIDISTDAGYVHLIHEDPCVVENDYEAIVSMMPTMFEISSK